MQHAYRLAYNDPRWLNCRRRQLKRAMWRCAECGGNGPLHVHHLVYYPGRAPWDYPDSDFTVLCTLCHERAHHLVGTERQLPLFTLQELEATGMYHAANDPHWKKVA